MTNQEALHRLQRQDLYVQQRMEQRQADGLPHTHQVKDHEALALAMAALEYVIAVEAYEQANPIS